MLAPLYALAPLAALLTRSTRSACPVNSYAGATGQTACHACGTGTSTEGKTGQAACSIVTAAVVDEEPAQTDTAVAAAAVRFAGTAPPGYTCTSDMTLCFKKMTVAASAWDAIDACKKDEARVCEYLDHMQLCAQGLNAKDHASTGWFGDHGKASGGNNDNEYGTWNSNTCKSNVDGPAEHYNKNKVYSCCRGAAGVTPACPAATKAMSTKNGEVCASDTQPAKNAMDAIKNCFTKGGHICSHGDMFQLAGNGHNPWNGGSRGWYGEHGFATGGNVDDEYMTWNRNHYTHDNDGPAAHGWTNNLPYRCCSSAPGTVCPSGFKLIGAQCMKDSGGTANYYSAQDTCKSSGAHICSHGEMMEMCANNGANTANPYAGDSHGWFGDHGTTTGGNWDDEFLTWNRNFCDPNNDGPAEHSTGSKAFRCCKQAATLAPKKQAGITTVLGDKCAVSFAYKSVTYEGRCTTVDGPDGGKSWCYLPAGTKGANGESWGACANPGVAVAVKTGWQLHSTGHECTEVKGGNKRGATLEQCKTHCSGKAFMDYKARDGATDGKHYCICSDVCTLVTYPAYDVYKWNAAPVVKWPDAGNHVWGVNSGDSVYYRAGKSGSWKPVSGALKEVSISADGNHVWGVNSADHIYIRHGFGGSWKQIPGALKQVSVSGDGSHVWGVNSHDHIYYRNGENKNWQRVAGALKYVKVSADGNHVWGVNSANHIYHRAGFSSDGTWQSKWVQIAGGLKVVGSSLIQTSEEAPVTGGGAEMDVSGPIVEMDTSGPLVAM